jgi:hypothetical protein
MLARLPAELRFCMPSCLFVQLFLMIFVPAEKKLACDLERCCARGRYRQSNTAR